MRYTHQTGRDACQGNTRLGLREPCKGIATFRNPHLQRWKLVMPCTEMRENSPGYARVHAERGEHARAPCRRFDISPRGHALQNMRVKRGHHQINIHPIIQARMINEHVE